MARHQQVTHDEFTVFARPKQILPDDLGISRNFRETLRASIITKFVIGEPNVEYVIQQFPRLLRTMRIGFPNQFRVRRHRRRDLERGWQVNCRFSSQDHDRPSASSEGSLGAVRQSLHFYGLTRAWVPAR